MSTAAESTLWEVVTEALWEALGPEATKPEVLGWLEGTEVAAGQHGRYWRDYVDTRDAYLDAFADEV